MTETTTATILFTDLVGSTELLERLGEDSAEELRRAHFAILRDAIATTRGEEVKNLGDGLMVAFAGASRALVCAVAMQQGVDRHNRRSPAAALGLRVGISAGEVTVEGGDYFGTPVIEAARLCAEATGGQILASAIVRAIAGSRGGFETRELGQRALKGLADTVRVLEVVWEPELSKLPEALTSVARLPLVGRDGELGRLRATWQAAGAGATRLAFVSGEPGIGKSRLCAALASEAVASGGTVLYGRCDEDLALPFQPFAEGLGDYLVLRPGALDELTDLHRPPLARLIPEVAHRMPATRWAVPPVDADPEGDRYRLFESVAALLSDAAREAPVLLILDDLHWADQPTLLMLRHVLRRVTGRLLALGTYRDTDLARTHPLSEMLADLRREADDERVSLRGLDREGVLALVEASAGRVSAGGEGLIEVLHAETQGNPFFVGEVLRHLTETGVLTEREGRVTYVGDPSDLGIPQGVRDVIGRRLNRLSDAANRTLSIAAVIGSEFDLDVLEAVEESAEPDVMLDALDEAVRARVLDEVASSRGRYRFAHALVRQTLYSELTSGRRSRLHAQVGEAIERVCTTDLDSQLIALAHHFCEGARRGLAHKAAAYAARAAAQLLERSAAEEAIRVAEEGLRALELEPDALVRCDLLLAIGEAQGFLRRMDVAAESCRGAIDAAREASSATRLARSVFWFGMVVTSSDDLVALVDEAIGGLGEREPGLRTRLLGLRSLFALDWSLAEAVRVGDDAVELGRSSGDDWALSFALFARGTAALVSPAVSLDLSLADEMLAVAERHGSLRHRCQALRFSAPMRLAAGDRAGFESAVAELAHLSSEASLAFFEFTVAFSNAVSAQLDGRWDDADRFGGSNPFVTAVTRLERGDLQSVADEMAALVELTPGHPVFRCALAGILASLGRDEDAREAAAPLIASGADALSDRPHAITSAAYLTEACSMLGEPEWAPALRRILTPRSGTLVVSRVSQCPGSVDRYLGMLDTVEGLIEDADARFKAASDLERSIAAPPLVARTAFWHATALAQRDTEQDRRRASTLAGEAFEISTRLGMADLSRRAAGLRSRLA